MWEFPWSTQKGKKLFEALLVTNWHVLLIYSFCFMWPQATQSKNKDRKWEFHVWYFYSSACVNIRLLCRHFLIYVMPNNNTLGLVSGGHKYLNQRMQTQLGIRDHWTLVMNRKTMLGGFMTMAVFSHYFTSLFVVWMLLYLTLVPLLSNISYYLFNSVFKAMKNIQSWWLH